MADKIDPIPESSSESPGAPPPIGRRDFFRSVARVTLGGVGAALVPELRPASALADEGDNGAATQLASQTEHALRWAGADPSDWAHLRGDADHNVVIVGGGQSGLGIAYGLKRKGVGQVEIIDAVEPGQIGVWLPIARMRQLNTPKEFIGPAQTNPALDFRAWYEALHGPEAFAKLERTPRLAWADYLAWFQQVTAPKIRYRTRLLDIEPLQDVLRLHLESDGVTRTETTRKLVLATGYAGAGKINVPALLRALPPQVLSHSATPPPYEALSGKVIGVLGAGASAFDAAATALENGAAEVHLFSRRSFVDYPVPGARTPNTASTTKRGHANVVELLYELPDVVRWRNYMQRQRRVGSVTLDTIQRAVAFKNFNLYLNASWTRVALSGKKVVAEVGGKKHRFDHVIAATGYSVDLAARPELARIVPSIALWRDRYQPEAGEEDPAAGLHPYVGPGFELLARPGVDAGYLRNIHLFNLASRLSFGVPVGDIPSAVDHPRLVNAITRDLFVQTVDVAVHQHFVESSGQEPPDPAPYKAALRQV